ncbi:MAG: hypothetical protein IKY67_12920 [Paludibacteraceae bacterium]|nr:hypothetical protein [Paludibacteraceae bacterium]
MIFHYAKLGYYSLHKDTASYPKSLQKVLAIEDTLAEEFSQWHNSDTAKLFSPPKFENKKEKKGYWF